MKNTNRISGRASSIPAGLALGGAVSVGVTILFAAIMAKLLVSESMTWENAGYGIMVLLIASSFAGAEVAYRKIKRQKLMICMLSGLVYFAILLSITALFFGGQYEAVGVTMGLITAGCGSAALRIQGRRGGKNRKYRTHCC